VAKLAGTTPTGVRLFRRRNGIPAARVELEPTSVGVRARAEATVNEPALPPALPRGERLFRGVASCEAEMKRFLVVGETVVVATARAVTALGPAWTVRSLTLVGEVLS
jgi:hypothetical protein